MTADPTSNMDGRTLGDYELREQLGAGGMGAVYKAYEKKLARFVAVKILAPSLQMDSTCVARFQREARSISNLRHPNLMHVYSVGEENGVHYFAMEYIDGVSLSQRISTAGQLSLAETIEIGGQILSALACVHATGLVHRDLKPGNIMIDTENRAVLVDFGLSKDREELGLTTTGALLGTPDYMAPEQVEAGEVGPQTDLYSLALVMFEMLANTRPFHRRSAIMTMRAHCEEKSPLLAELRGDLPPRLSAVLDKALSRQLGDRYQSAGEFAQALQEVYPHPTLEALVSDDRSWATAKTVVSEGTTETIVIPASAPVPESPAKTAPPKNRRLNVSTIKRELPNKPTNKKHTHPKSSLQKQETRQRSWLGWSIAGIAVWLVFVVVLALRSGEEVEPGKKITGYNAAAQNGRNGVKSPRFRILRTDNRLVDGELISLDGEKLRYNDRKTGREKTLSLRLIKTIHYLKEWPRKHPATLPSPDLDNLRPPRLLRRLTPLPK